MKPKFKSQKVWEQAQLLMQPAFIRVIDNLRKELERSIWRGTYEEVQSPYPGYLLSLTYQDRSVTVDIWDLCFQVCFQNYQLTHTDREVEVEIDTGLIDETGDVDWHQLETKTQFLIKQIFANLPNS